MRVRQLGPGLPWAALLLGALLSPAPARGQDEGQDASCLECHADSGMEDRYRVAPATWQASYHAELGFGCVDCHSGKSDYPHEEGAQPVSCSSCHEEAQEAWERSIHADSQRRNGDRSAWPAGNACAVCHGVHDVLAVADPQSPVHSQNVPKTCGQCHGDLAIVESQGLSAAPFENYQKSVHGTKQNDPEAKAAVCSSCHRSHDVLIASDPESPINPFHIASTCGQCHAQEAQEYLSSVHGVAFAKGISAAPTCTDCHGIHSIKMVPKAGATPLEERLVRSTCSTCHSSEALVGEYGVAPARVSSYKATYHGLANMRGTAFVADCASCHGIHTIFPSTDPRSTVAPANLETTCGSCHPGASQEFVKSPVHFVAGGKPTLDVVVTAWVTRIYWVLIFGVLGGMLIHNGIIITYYIRRKARRERQLRGVPRFNRAQIAQHTILFLTFFVLTISGFALAYPEVWWSRLLESVGLNEPLRRLIHRIAAIVLVGTGVFHVLWLWLTPYGRSELRAILPRLRDVRELVANLSFHLERNASPPTHDKYDYSAKLEYWAVVWGTVIMAVTGTILWFPVWATSFLPYWTVKVSEVVHLFEAWLATLSILFFHFFYVMGHPEIAPMNLSMFTGFITEEEARRRHPEWFNAIQPAPLPAVEPPESGASPEQPAETPQ